eukprot:10591-Eustigmatos_ZCMA.PRE.1
MRCGPMSVQVYIASKCHRWVVQCECVHESRRCAKPPLFCYRVRCFAIECKIALGYLWCPVWN